MLKKIYIAFSILDLLIYCLFTFLWLKQKVQWDILQNNFVSYLNFESSKYACLPSPNLFNFLFVVIKDSACRYINYHFFVTFSEFSYNARSMGRCRHLRSVKRHPRNVILVFIFFFLSLIVYIFKNFSQIFADMSACLSDNKVIFTRETVLKFIWSLRACTSAFFSLYDLTTAWQYV